MVIIRIHGTLDPAQLWPHGDGDGDADTLKVVVRLDEPGFELRRPGQPFQPTHLFDDASVLGEQGASPIIDRAGRLTVRLEGIDAPELHCEPRSALRDPPPRPARRQAGVRYRTRAQRERFLEVNERYRQPFAETAAVRLGELLRTLGRPPLRCRVEMKWSSVDHGAAWPWLRNSATAVATARLGHVTRARVTQIMDLTLLAPDIQEEVLHLPPVIRGQDPITLRELRYVMQTPVWEEQRERWAEVRCGQEFLT